MRKYETLDNNLTKVEMNEDSDVDEEVAKDLRNKQTVSVWKTSFNIMNFTTGSIFLAIPYAVKMGGISALLSLVIFPCALCYTGEILIECLYSRDSLHGEKIRVRSTYRDIGEASLPRVGGILVDVFAYGDLFFSSVFMFVFYGQLLSFTLPSFPLTQTTWVLVIAAVVLPTIFLEKLGQIAWLSVVGMSAVLIVTTVAIGCGLNRISVQTFGWQNSELLFWNTENVALAVGITFFSYESHLLLTDMEESMADREKFGRALCGGYASLTIIKIIFSLLTFCAFGQGTEEIVIHNLPAGFIRITLTTLYVTSTITTFSLLVHAVIHNLEHTHAAKYLMSILPRLVWFIGTRLVFFILAVSTAIQIHHFASLSAFLGSLFTPLVTTVFPCAFHLRLKYKGLSFCEITADVVLGTGGLFLSVVLLYFSSKNLFDGQ